MFSSKYVAYKIKTEPYGWDVQRRFNDFNWLRCILAREFPAYFIPPILPKTTKRKFEKYFIYKRMAFFNKFLKAISQHTELKNSKYYIAFLKTQDDAQWEQIKEDLGKHLNKISEIRAYYQRKKLEG
jgi:PX domain